MNAARLARLKLRDPERGKTPRDFLGRAPHIITVFGRSMAAGSGGTFPEGWFVPLGQLKLLHYRLFPRGRAPTSEELRLSYCRRLGAGRGAYALWI